MKRVLLLTSVALAASTPVRATDYDVGTLHVTAPWARATPKGASVGGGYLTITNRGTESDRLVGCSVAVSGACTLHSMSMENGVMKMRPVAAGIDIEPGETVTLAPSGYHLMFQQLKAPLTRGETVKGTLTFAEAGTLDILFQVESIGANAASSGGMSMPMHSH